MLAHLALAVKRGRLAKDWVAFQQHLADVVERAALGILQPVEIAGIAKLREQVGQIRPDLLVSQSDLAAEVVLDFRLQKLPQRMPFADLCHGPHASWRLRAGSTPTSKNAGRGGHPCGASCSVRVRLSRNSGRCRGCKNWQSSAQSADKTPEKTSVGRNGAKR